MKYTATINNIDKVFSDKEAIQELIITGGMYWGNYHCQWD